MGRELKRVSLDFDWPLNIVWKGYVSPYRSQECTVCGGSGYSPEARRLYDQWYGNASFDPAETGSEPLAPDTPAVWEFAKRNVERDALFYRQMHGSPRAFDAIRMEAARLAEMWNRQWNHHLEQADVDALIAADRLWDFTRVPLTDEHRAIVAEKMRNGGNSWLPFDNGYRPTAAEVNEWAIRTTGHDSLNSWVCVTAKCQRLGVPERCEFCGGDGAIWFSERIKQLADAWYDDERYGPPEGDGWQVWETVSEGSPISPVFTDADGVYRWLLQQGYSQPAALAFIDAQWAPSMVMVGGEVKDGIETLT